MTTPMDLDQRIGYQLKCVASAMRAEMETVLRPVGLGVPQYACLELLAHRPGLSNAELARGAFVSRQAMNVVLRGLQDGGLVRRADTVDRGRARPALLTDDGRARLLAARQAVLALESRVRGALPPERVDAMLADLAVLGAALTR